MYHTTTTSPARPAQHRTWPFHQTRHQQALHTGQCLLQPRHARACQRLTPCAAEPGSGSDAPLSRNEAAALKQALDIYHQAKTLAQLSTQHELQQAFLAEMDGPESSDENSATPRMLQAFLEEQGLSEVEAARLVGEMRSTGLTRFSIAAIGAKLQRWQRVLVDVDVVRLLQKDASLLERDVNLAVMNLIQLVDKLPGRDMNSLISRQPRLLWCEDLGARTERVLSHLVRLHPSRSWDVVAGLVAEHPELLYRMDYYTEARMIDELPMEIQNMFIIADQGLGAMHSYWRRHAAAINTSSNVNTSNIATGSSESDNEYGY